MFQSLIHSEEISVYKLKEISVFKLEYNFSFSHLNIQLSRSSILLKSKSFPLIKLPCHPCHKKNPYITSLLLGSLFHSWGSFIYPCNNRTIVISWYYIYSSTFSVVLVTLGPLNFHINYRTSLLSSTV